MLFTGVAGGYSIVNVRRYGDRVYLLTGSIPADGQPSGKQLLDRFVTIYPDHVPPTSILREFIGESGFEY